jgi:hypothetical protein
MATQRSDEDKLQERTVEGDEEGDSTRSGNAALSDVSAKGVGHILKETECDGSLSGQDQDGAKKKLRLQRWGKSE